MNDANWHHPRPNQQAIAALLAGDGNDERSAQLRRLGHHLRGAFAHTPLPLFAVQSHFSRLEGTASLHEWSAFFSALHEDTPAQKPNRRGGNHPAGASAVYAVSGLVEKMRHESPAPSTPIRLPDFRTPGPPDFLTSTVWAALADRDDCCGLPQALEVWGDHHVGLGATMALSGGDVVVLAPDEAARRVLCQVLSARHDGQPYLCWKGLIVLVRDVAAGEMLHQRGAEVWWRADHYPEVRPVPFPIACVPLLRHLDASDQATAALRDAIRRGGTRDPHFPQGLTAADLVALPIRFAGREEQLAAGAALRERLRWRPEHTWILPPLAGEFLGCDPNHELRRLAEAGIARRYAPAQQKAAHARLDLELTVIAAKRFASYLLTVWSLTRDRTTCGRGSGASSIVCYLLEITNVDPLVAKLRFDRFLAPDREDPPDLDVDFPWDERDAVFAAVFRRFGAEHVAMVATHQSLQRDSARREAAKAYGLAGSGDEGDPRWPRILAEAEAITGAPRHLGLHCGGIVVTDVPIRDIVPVHRAAKRIAEHPDTAEGVPTIAWEKDGAEALRLVKIDLLGNRSLAVVRDALADLAADGIVIDTARWDPTTDTKTQGLVARGDTLGCFYIESPATRLLQAKVGSGDFDRLVVHSSMIRPAGSPFIDAYIQRHRHVMANNGVIPPACEGEWFPHPSLRTLLSETYGVFAYQEDVMGAAETLAGFSSKQSNELRKALGRNDTQTKMPRIAAAFASGCRERKIPDAVADEVWRMIASFAGYSFCKAHSASYAMVSFQCAWLKAHFPAHFLARVIANEGGFYAPWAYVEEARRLGVRILAPCVQASTWATQREAAMRRNIPCEAIRLGFHLVRGLSRSTANSIVGARPFVNVNDLLARTACASDELLALREAGALDALTPHLDEARRSWLIARCLRKPPPRLTSDTQDSHIDFGITTVEPDPLPPHLPPLPDHYAPRLRLARLGVMVDCHFLTLHPLPRRPRWRARDVTAANQGRNIALIAMMITSKTVHARSRQETGKDDDTSDGALHFRDMAFVTLEDETGLVEATWFPEAWAAYGHLLDGHIPLRVEGRIEVSFGVATLTVQQVRRCSDDSS